MCVFDVFVVGFYLLLLFGVVGVVWVCGLFIGVLLGLFVEELVCLFGCFGCGFGLVVIFGLGFSSGWVWVLVFNSICLYFFSLLRGWWVLCWFAGLMLVELFAGCVCFSLLCGFVDVVLFVFCRVGFWGL